MTARLALLASLALIAGSLTACGGGSAPPAGVSAACNAAWTAQENPAGGGKSDALMAVTFTACSTFTEWKAGWNAHPLAHGSALDPSTFVAVRCDNPESDLGDVTRSPVCQTAP